MKNIAVYVLISFFCIAVLGFSGLTSHDSLFSQCVNATIPGGMPCSEAAHHDPGMNFLHAKIFQNFSLAMLVAAILLAVYAFFPSLVQTQQQFRFVSLAAVNLQAEYSSLQQKTHSWLELVQQHPARA